MSVMVQGQIQFVGGRLCLDFVNTQVRKQNKDIDFLPDSDHLLAWLRAANAVSEDEADVLRAKWQQGECGQKALQRAFTFRAAFRRIVEGVMAGQPAHPAALAELNAVLAETLTYPQVQQHDGKYIKFESVTSAEDRWLAVITHDAVDLLCDGDLSLLKQCDGPTCIRLFYDMTKNHKRRWCSVEKCGSRAKAAAYYKRKCNPE